MVYTFERITVISYGVPLFIKMWRIWLKHVRVFLIDLWKHQFNANKSEIPMQSTPAGCVSHWPDEVHPSCSQFWMLSSSPSQFIPDSNTGTWVSPERLSLVIAVAYKIRSNIETKNIMKQKSIPAGCAPLTCQPYLFWWHPLGVSTGGGVGIWRGQWG